MCKRKSNSLYRGCSSPCRVFRPRGIVRGLPGEPCPATSHASASSDLHRHHRASKWGATVTSDSQLGAESRTNLKELWRAALGELQLAMPKANYDTWFKETYVVSEEDDVYCIGVPNAFAREWLDNKYRSQVRTSLQRLVGRTVDVRFITVPGVQAPSAGTGLRPASSLNSGANPATSGLSVTPIAPPSERRGEASPVTAILN